MEVIATEPAAGARVAPGTTITARLRLAPGSAPHGLALRLDGEDVTARCALRTERAHPPRRADLVLAGPLGPGEHEAVLSWSRPPGTHAWRFTVGGTDEDVCER
jgi:hypothetical protein